MWKGSGGGMVGGEGEELECESEEEVSWKSYLQRGRDVDE
jgi:hypothetical protein